MEFVNACWVQPVRANTPQQAHRDVLGQPDRTHTDKSVEVQGTVVGSHETRGAGEPDHSKHVDAALRGSQSCEDRKVTIRQE